MKTYCVGLIKGSSLDWFQSNVYDRNTLILQARECLVNPCIWKFCEGRMVTKSQLFKDRFKILKVVNAHYKTAFSRITIDYN